MTKKYFHTFLRMSKIVERGYWVVSMAHNYVPTRMLSYMLGLIENLIL